MAVLVEVHDARRARPGAAPAHAAASASTTATCAPSRSRWRRRSACCRRCLPTACSSPRAASSRAADVQPHARRGRRTPSSSARPSCARRTPASRWPGCSGDGRRPAGRVRRRLPRSWAAALPGWTAGARAAAGRERRAASPGRVRSARRIRFGRCAWSPPTRSRWWSSGRTPTRAPATPTAWPSRPGAAEPRSLARIFEVLARDRPGFEPPATWRLDAWAAPGRAAAQPRPDRRDRPRRQPRATAVGRRSLAQIVAGSVRRIQPPVFLLWGAKAQALLRRARCPRQRRARRCWPPAIPPTTSSASSWPIRPSHFEATSALVDWWRIDSTARAPCYSPGFSRRGARVAKGGRL